MKNFKIGIIVPVSGIYKKLGVDFRIGLELALKKYQIQKIYNIEISYEINASGYGKSFFETVYKMVNINDIDLVTGIANNNVLNSYIDVIQSRKLPFLINNLGEFIPKPSLNIDNLFINSLNLWQSQYALGKWAQKKYKSDPVIYSSIYDTGYQLSSAFSAGALQNGAANADIRIMHLNEGIVDTSPLIERLKEDNPSHAHVILCGVDADDFIQRLYKSGLYQTIPVTVSPFMVEDQIADHISENIASYPNSMTWSSKINNKENKDFTNNIWETHNKKANIFSLLGYETGIAIGETLTHLENNNDRLTNENLLEALKKITIKGPRGTHRLNGHEYPCYLRIPEQKEKQIENQVKSEIESIKHTDNRIITMAKQNISGWENPYLCI